MLYETRVVNSYTLTGFLPTFQDSGVGDWCMGVTRAVLIFILFRLAQAAFHVPPRRSRALRSLRSKVCTNKRGLAAGFAMAASKTSRVVIVPGNG